ncbi:co-chaperone YbbN [Bacillus sp. JCM 19034]|uniref:thioredoxin family protein n=1 Tax=Bacillus sp. JCM 19034 TaxID=1481928 RepID=UPI0007803564|nr:thioredoxin family protein [Bacillus sp. JCM 19034]
MKKVVIFLLIVIAIFGALAIVNHISTSQKVEGNPYGKTNLNPATIDQLDNPTYQNIILPDDLEIAINNGESMTVYFFQPTCPACVATSPIIVPMAEELGIDLKLYNLLEFEDGWIDYDIAATPTVVHFENGEEVSRIGYVEEDLYQEWFEQIN